MDEQTKEDLFYRALQQSRSLNRESAITILEQVASEPAIQERAFSIFASWMYPQRVLRVAPRLLPLQALRKNVEAVSVALAEDIQQRHMHSFSQRAFKKIYFREGMFEANTQLHKSPYDKLKVSDIVEIISYAMECAKQFSDIDTANVEEGLLILKSVDLALNNQPHDRPLLKATHLAVDILSALLQNFESDPMAKKRISGGAKMVQLAISFFTGK